MRLYTFCNYYLSSLQQGLQTAHVVHELFNKYDVNQFSSSTDESAYSLERELQLRDWSQNHKTIVILNGGNCQTLTDLVQFLHSMQNPFPYTGFCEDGESLNFALTCVGIVLPERIYDAAEKIRSRSMELLDYIHGGFHLQKKNAGGSFSFDEHAPKFSVFEKELIERLNMCGLAK